MLDDIIEAAVDILGDILEAILSSKLSKKGKKQRSVKQNAVRTEDPWEQHDKAAPWEK